jgi:FkbM family methyltransferase
MQIPPAYAAYFADEQPVRDKWWHPAEGEQVIDIGCYMGNYTLPALAAGAHVLAVDADAGAIEVLRTVADTNGFLGQLAIRNVALFDDEPYPEGLKEAIGTSPWAYHSIRSGTLFTTLDQLVADCGLGRLDWVKIDVEGSEAGVLRGGVKSLERWHPQVLIEDHSIPYPWVKEQQITRQCTEVLEGLGYTVQQWVFDAPRMFLVATPERHRVKT